MVNYSDITALRAASNEFIRVELSGHKVEGENGLEVHQGVDYQVNKGYVANAMVVGALGLGQPVLSMIGATPFSVFCAQSLLLGVMVGCLAKRAAANGRLKQVEDAYIREHGTPNEIDQSNQFHASTTRVQSIKRFVLGAAASFTAGVVVMDLASGQSNTVSTALSVLAGVSVLGGAVVHVVDKMVAGDRGQLAHAIAARRGETTSAPPASPMKNLAL